jgi:hypothetical protein
MKIHKGMENEEIKISDEPIKGQENDALKYFLDLEAPAITPQALTDWPLSCKAMCIDYKHVF